MKLQIPSRKKNKADIAETEGAVFDLTGSTDSKQEESSAGERVRKALRRSSRQDSGIAVPETSAAAFGLIDSYEDSFEVNVRNEDSLIRPLNIAGEKRLWLRDVQTNLASGFIIMSLLCLILAAAGEAGKILFVIPGLIIYMLIATLGSKDDDRIRRIRLYVSIAIAVLLVAALIVLRKYIGNGLELIMNSLYDYAEAAQAYVYDRFEIGSTGDNNPYLCMMLGTLWISLLTGLVTAYPSAAARRIIALAAAVFSMLAFAYYGLIPSWVCIAVIAAALIFVLSRGSILSTLAVFAAVLVVFGAVMLIDPGESYGISRVDENFRDRFAFKSSYLERDAESINDLTEIEEQQQDQQNRNTGEGSEFFEEHRGLVVVIVLILILAAIGAAVWMFMQRIKKRQAEHRAGIDSSDPKQAIIAMFPYAVRWLQPAGIDTSGKTFPSLVPAIRSDVSEEYADRYAGMYELWKEAAYSDHEMSEDNRTEMNSFLSDTIAMIKDRGDLSTRIATIVKYAL